MLHSDSSTSDSATSLDRYTYTYFLSEYEAYLLAKKNYHDTQSKITTIKVCKFFCNTRVKVMQTFQIAATGFFP